MSTSLSFVSTDDDCSPTPNDCSPDSADMHSLTNSMGNVTDTMTAFLKSFLRLSVALVVLVGLSTGAAMGQNVFDVDEDNDGTIESSYTAGEFQDALDDASQNANTGIIFVTDDNVDLNDATGTSQYTTAGSQDVVIRADASLPADAIATVTLDRDLNLGQGGNAVRLALDGDGSDQGVNLEFPGNNISLLADGSQSPNVVGPNGSASGVSLGGSDVANRLVFSGETNIEELNQTGVQEIVVDRVAVTGGPATFVDNDNPGVNPDELAVREFLDVSGELDLGGSVLNFTEAPTLALPIDVANDAADLRVSGTVSNGNRFNIDLTTSDASLGPTPDARYTIEGDGDLAVPVTYQTSSTILGSNQIDETVFEQTAIGQFGFSNFGTAGAVNDVFFPFLEQVRASLRIQDNGGFNTVVEFGDPFPDPNLPSTSPNVFAGSSTSLTVDGKLDIGNGATVETAPDLALEVDGDFEIDGGAVANIPTTDTDPSGPSGFVPPGNRIASAADTPLTLNGAADINGGTLNLRVPGPAGERVRSEINGELTLAGGTIALEDETNVTSGAADGQGLHNVSINGDANFQQNNINDGGNGIRIASDPADPNLAPLEEPTVFIGGSSGTLDVTASQLDISRLVIDGTSELTGSGPLVVGTRIILKDGIFTSNGSLSAGGLAGGVELIRVNDADGNGQLRAGPNSAVAYTGPLGDPDGNGRTNLAVPERVEYQGANSISTGNELIRPPEAAADRQVQDFVVDMEQNIDAVVTLNPDYTVFNNLEVRNGDLSLGSATLTLANALDLVRGDGEIVEGPQRDLVFPSVTSAQAGRRGIDLQYVNDESNIDVGVEWKTTAQNANVVRSVQIDAGGQEVALDSTRGNGVYRTNGVLDLDRGTLDVNGNTLEHNGPETANAAGGTPLALNGGRVDYDDEAAMTDGGDGGLFRFIGGRRVTGTGTGTVETPVNATTDEDAAQDFPFPETEVAKGPNSHVNFNINDTGSSVNNNGFTFGGDFTISDAQNFDGSGDTDVPASAPGSRDLTRDDGVQFTDDVFQVAVQGSFVQEAGSFGANPNTLVSFDVEGSLTKTASDSSRFLADAETFEVGTTSGPDSLAQESGTFEVNNSNIAGNFVAPSFTVNGDLQNSSPDALSFPPATGATYSSRALQVDETGANGAAFEVTGDITQAAGVLRIGGPRTSTGTNPGYNNGSVAVGGSFAHEDGTTSIPNASAVDVASDVTVTAGLFRANLSDNSGVTTPPDNTFEASALTVGDSTDASGGPGGDFTSGQDATFEAAPGPSASGADNDDIVIPGQVSVRFDAQLALGGQALRTESDFEFLGAGDQLVENNDPDNSGLEGTVRFEGTEDTLSVETDETPDTFLNGLVIDLENGDLELASSVQTNRVGGAFNFGNSRRPMGPSPNPTRNFGTIALERGNVLTGEDTLTVREPTPTSGGDLLEANNADEVSPPPPRGGTPGQSPVLGGSRNSHVVGTLRRALDETTPNTGGFVEDGYIYPIGDGETYSAAVVEPATDFGRSQFFTTTLTDDPGIELPDGLTSDGFNSITGEEIVLDLDVQSEPYYRIETEQTPDENVNVRMIAGDLSGRVDEIKQLRIVQFDTDAGDVQEAGTYDFTGDPADDQTAGPNSFISGVPNVHHEGVDFREGNVIGIASDSEFNLLGENSAPSFAPADQPGDQSVNVGESAEVTFTAQDPNTDGADLSFTVDSDVNVTSSSQSGGELTVTIEPDSADAEDSFVAGGTDDTLDLVVEASDPEGQTGSTSIGVTAGLQNGDANSSGSVNTADASDALDAFLENVSLTPVQTDAADQNDDGNVTPFDAAQILQLALGSSSAQIASAKTGGSSAGTVVIGDADRSGGALTLPVELTGETENVRSVAVEIDLEGASQKVADVATSLPGGWMADHKSFSDGTLKIGMAGSSALSAGQIATIQLQGTDAPADETSGTFRLNGSDAQDLEVQVSPESFALNGNYPNPFSTSTTISYDLKEAVDVSIEVYDILGRKVGTLVDKKQSAGSYEVSLDKGSGLGAQMSSGVYVYRITAGDFTATEKMTVVK